MTRISSAFAYGAFIVGAALLLKALEWAGYVTGSPDEMAQRFVQVAVGTVFLWYANRMPKGAATKANCPLAKEDQMRRFAGRVLFLGGIGYVLTWVIAPFDIAAVTSIAILGSALALVFGRWAMTRMAAE
ncbi:MAG TPA: hypothetical protein PLA85_09685 [Micropepsaceae bacterium]|nr:hypothetical protein [Micropepsaceae bacterium]